MHIESYFQDRGEYPLNVNEAAVAKASSKAEAWIDPDEVDEIINRTYFANRGKKSAWKRRKPTKESNYRPIVRTMERAEFKEEYLLVDGYNIIHAWPELKTLVDDDHMEAAREKLQNILSNYQGIRRTHIILVFDAYRVPGRREEIIDYNNIHIVYTREAQTADHYIEKFVHDHHKKYRITVATSDAVEQMIIRGKGAALMSARELREEVHWVVSAAIQAYREKYGGQPNYLVDLLSGDTKDYMTGLLDGDEK